MIKYGCKSIIGSCLETYNYNNKYKQGFTSFSPVQESKEGSKIPPLFGSSGLN